MRGVWVDNTHYADLDGSAPYIAGDVALWEYSYTFYTSVSSTSGRRGIV